MGGIWGAIVSALFAQQWITDLDGTVFPGKTFIRP